MLHVSSHLHFISITHMSSLTKTFCLLLVTPGAEGNNYFPLGGALDLFEKESLGGTNYETRADKLVELDYGATEPVVTDIDFVKVIFRDRSWVRPFLTLYKLKPGDTVKLEKLDKYRFRIRPYT